MGADAQNVPVPQNGGAAGRDRGLSAAAFQTYSARISRIPDADLPRGNIYEGLPFGNGGVINNDLIFIAPADAHLFFRVKNVPMLFPVGFDRNTEHPSAGCRDRSVPGIRVRIAQRIPQHILPNDPFGGLIEFSLLVLFSVANQIYRKRDHDDGDVCCHKNQQMHHLPVTAGRSVNRRRCL